VANRDVQWPALDGLRAIAVLLVVGFHASGLVHNGYIGVDVFFVLSGFLITSLLLGEQDSTGAIDIRAFYRRRALRLYPALLALCVIVVAVAALIRQHFVDVLLGAITTLAYIANIWEYAGGHDTYFFQHTWTLALEEQFYLLWPVLLCLMIRWHWTVWAVGAAWITLELCDAALGQPPALHTYIRAAGLPLGCVLAFAAASPRAMRLLSALGWPALVALVALALAPLDGGWLLTSWPVGLSALLSVPVLTAAVADAALARILSVRPALWLGRRSYGLYLWHFPVLSAVIDHAPGNIPPFARNTVGVLASVVLAASSYRWIEQPVRRRLRDPSAVDQPAARSRLTLQ
jgi:peptidoglycan/LPS O-acetylase OafA/YrhL